MVVIGIVLLLMGLAVPAFSLISGRTSLESAENQISAMLGRARASAIGLGRKQGIMFVHDRRNDRIAIAEVFGTSGPPTPAPGVDVYLDLVPDREFIYLPPNVSVQTVTNCDMDMSVTPNERLDDGYIGFNYYAPVGVVSVNVLNPYGGVILFDANGRLISQRYAFRGISDPATLHLFDLFYDDGDESTITPSPPAFDIVPMTRFGEPLRSQVGLVLFDRSAYENVNGTVEYAAYAGPPPATVPRRTAPDWELPDLGAATPEVSGTELYTDPWVDTGKTEREEEDWLDDNAVPLLVNRYNGTLMRGE